MDDTYIKLYRALKDWQWADDPNTLSLWLHLLLRANYKPSKYRGYDIPAGGLVYGHAAYARHTGLSKQQVRTSFNKLKSAKSLTPFLTPSFQIVTITEWGIYQSGGESVTPFLTPKQHPLNTPLTPSKEGKKGRREEYIHMLSHMCPTAVEIWNEEMNGVLPAVVSLGDVRKKKLIKLLKEIGCEKKGVDEFRKFCQIIKRSDFLTGKKTDWKANFDFCIKPANFLKIVEGNYDD